MIAQQQQYSYDIMSLNDSERHWSNKRRHSIIGITLANKNKDELSNISLKEAFHRRKSIHQLAREVTDLSEIVSENEKSNERGSIVSSQNSRRMSFSK